MRKISPLWIVAGFFFLLGLFMEFVLVGYSFSALVCCGAGLLAVIYQLLAILKRKKPKQAVLLRRIFSVLLVIGLLAAAVTGGVIVCNSRGNADMDCEYIVVLGAGVNGTVPSLSLQERLDAAQAYLTAHPDAIAVVSGCQGNGEDISEAECMFRELTQAGIDPNRVWMEDQATNTRENLKFSLDLVENRTGIRPEKIGIVSSEYHLYRARMFADRQNIESFGIPARTSWVSLRINYYLREIAAVWYYTILGG